MKLWKRIAALCLSVSTMGVSLLSTGCDMSDVVGLVDDVQSSSLENSVDSASESADCFTTYLYGKRRKSSQMCVW